MFFTRGIPKKPRHQSTRKHTQLTLQPRLEARALAGHTTRVSQVCVALPWLVALSEAAVRPLSSPHLSLLFWRCVCVCGVRCVVRAAKKRTRYLVLIWMLDIVRISDMVTMPEFGLEGVSLILAEIVSLFLYIIFICSNRFFSVFVLCTDTTGNKQHMGGAGRVIQSACYTAIRVHACRPPAERAGSNITRVR